MINATVPLKKESQYNSIEWKQLKNKLIYVDMTVTFMASKRIQIFRKMLVSFFTFNTYPIKRILAVYDGPLTPQLQSVIKDYKNITWLITNIKVGQLQALDQLNQLIQTEHFFHSEDDFQFIKPGFIEYCLQASQFDEKFNYVTIHFGQRMKPPIKVGPLNVATHFQTIYAGFSFWPTVNRMSRYRELQVEYNMATFNLSYGRGAGFCELMIRKIYIMKGYYRTISNIQFALHPGSKVTTGNKAWKKYLKQSAQMDALLEKYDQWVKEHSNEKQFKQKIVNPLLAKLSKLQQLQNSQLDSKIKSNISKIERLTTKQNYTNSTKK